ncbi:Fic family protein [Desulfatibacillum aliphaticivorans]|uniref:Fic family protein n=1 Tax=Desulfatibacillum aliphaticivorans TaxID=218208 RepID=UPI0003FA5357|nr:Fic family protein [Desulfatibacillum aliphaticivorans]
MAPTKEKLAQSLAVLKKLQDKGIVAIHTKNMTRTHRERLVKNGFIKEVMKGWYVPSRPDEPAGESTAWYASYWSFCADYLEARFGGQWCLSPEQSLRIHSGNWSVPGQLVVRTPKGGNKPVTLLHGTSILDLRLKLPEKKDITSKENLRIMTLPAALIACAPSYYPNNAVDARAALSMISDASGILHKLLEGGHSTVAGRLAGAFRNIGRGDIADNIVEAMKAAGFSIIEDDPFEQKPSIDFSGRERSPYVNRIRMHWADMRGVVLENFPQAPSPPMKVDKYLERVDEIYLTDAYHSLSIEGYRVSRELIDRVRSGDWDPETNRKDQEYADALAARGYWQSFQAVKNSLATILNGGSPGAAAGRDHSTWYRELFAPGVNAGLVAPSDLAGYRNQPVYIRESRHVPPRWEAVRDLMPAFFSLLEGENEPAVRAVLGHFFFVYIHPYMDGNGRMARFLMNVMLASGGYPWAVIPVETRSQYMAALEEASVNLNIKPFSRFLAELVQKGMA